jgi:hypothetical protein
MRFQSFALQWSTVFAILIAFLVLFSPIGINRSNLIVYGLLDTMDIQWIEVQQYNGTVWNQVNNYTATGGSDRILDSQLVNFTIEVSINKTVATTINDAQSYTRVNGTIGIGNDHSIWDNVALNLSATYQSDATYWYVWFVGNWTSSLAVGGLTYNCTFVYQAYY